MGSVKIPSSTIFIESLLILMMSHATISPRKNVMKIDRLAVFIEIKIGDQSIMSLPLFIICFWVHIYNKFYSWMVNPYSTNASLASFVCKNSRNLSAASECCDPLTFATG